MVEAYFEDLTPEQFEQMPLGEAVRGSVRRELLHVVHEELFIGPLPPPAVLERYATIYPEAPAVIFQAFRKQVDHRIELERFAVTSNAKRSTEGLRLGFVITMFSLILGGFLIMNGHDQAGAAIIVTNLAALAGVFVYGSQQQSEERRKKTQTKEDALPDREPGKLSPEKSQDSRDDTLEPN